MIKEFSIFWGVLIPALVLVTSFLVTLLLFKVFSRGDGGEDR
jgi:hypothetical protein